MVPYDNLLHVVCSALNNGIFMIGSSDRFLPSFINFISFNSVVPLPPGVVADDLRDGASGVLSDAFPRIFRAFSGVEILGCGGGDLKQK